jgi:predicted AAA+ superfamily ATPase
MGANQARANQVLRRGFWIAVLERAWARRNVLWLSGVRRTGKTILCQSLPEIEYFDCELPRTRQRMEDPESFLQSLDGKRVVLDEIHRLANPSELLKIAADHFSKVRLLATGSSSLGASSRFRDTLTDRKSDIWLTPMMSRDLLDFGGPGVDERLLKGGLPPFFLAPATDGRNYQDWLDAYWAKDILELFRLERRHSFLRFAELLLSRSGGTFEASRFSGECEVSRTTISNYLAVMEATYLVHVIRPYSSRRASEIVSAPKVFAFDTGFVCHFKGIDALRPEDRGLLWEHYVLNEIHARLQTRAVGYWRDKRGHEVDFILSRPAKAPIAIECKWSARDFDARNLAAFRRQHPGGANYVVATDVKVEFPQQFNGVDVRFVNLETLIGLLDSKKP